MYIEAISEPARRLERDREERARNDDHVPMSDARHSGRVEARDEPEGDEQTEDDSHDGEKPAALPEREGVRQVGPGEAKEPPQARAEERKHGDAEGEADAGAERDEALLPPGTREAPLDLEGVEHRVDAARGKPHEHHGRERRDGTAVPLGYQSELRSDEVAYGGRRRSEHRCAEVAMGHRETRENEAPDSRERQEREEEPERHLCSQPEGPRRVHAAPDELHPVDDDVQSVTSRGVGRRASVTIRCSAGSVGHGPRTAARVPSRL